MSTHNICFSSWGASNEYPQYMFTLRNKKNIRAQLFKTNKVVSEHIVKTLIIKYGIYTNIFAEKMWVAFFQQK